MAKTICPILVLDMECDEEKADQVHFIRRDVIIFAKGLELILTGVDCNENFLINNRDPLAHLLLRFLRPSSRFLVQGRLGKNTIKKRDLSSRP